MNIKDIIAVWGIRHEPLDRIFDRFICGSNSAQEILSRPIRVQVLFLEAIAR
jgi:hypothetical protein